MTQNYNHCQPADPLHFAAPAAEVKVVADATQDIPHGALLVELTPDGKESCWGREATAVDGEMLVDLILVDLG